MKDAKKYVHIMCDVSLSEIDAANRLSNPQLSYLCPACILMRSLDSPIQANDGNKSRNTTEKMSDKSNIPTTKVTLGPHIQIMPGIIGAHLSQTDVQTSNQDQTEHQTSEHNPGPKTAKDSIAEDQKRLRERVRNNKKWEEDLKQQAIWNKQTYPRN